MVVLWLYCLLNILTAMSEELGRRIRMSSSNLHAMGTSVIYILVPCKRSLDSTVCREK